MRLELQVRASKRSPSVTWALENALVKVRWAWVHSRAVTLGRLSVELQAGRGLAVTSDSLGSGITLEAVGASAFWALGLEHGILCPVVLVA